MLIRQCCLWLLAIVVGLVNVSADILPGERSAGEAYTKVHRLLALKGLALVKLLHLTNIAAVRISIGGRPVQHRKPQDAAGT
jgi:hypothetical protein